MLEMVEDRPKLVVNPYDSVRTATMTRVSTLLRGLVTYHLFL